jgi:hypothetical protein
MSGVDKHHEKKKETAGSGTREYREYTAKI